MQMCGLYTGNKQKWLRNTLNAVESEVDNFIKWNWHESYESCKINMENLTCDVCDYN